MMNKKKTLTPRDNAVLGDAELQAGLRTLDPDFGDFCIRVSGEAFGRPLLSQKTKVMIALVVDIVEQLHGPQFANHIMMAKKQGITREELEELLLFMTVYVGFNKAGGYYPAINQIFGPKKPVRTAKPAARAAAAKAKK